MKYLNLLICFALIGCAHKPKRQAVEYSAPTGFVKVSEHVQKAKTATAKAQAKIEVIKVTGAKPNDPAIIEVQTALAETTNDLANAQTAIETYKIEVQKQTDNLNVAVKEKNAALEQVEYWHDKQVKAVGKLWFWRSVSAALAAAIACYIGWRVFR